MTGGAPFWIALGAVILTARWWSRALSYVGGWAADLFGAAVQDPLSLRKRRVRLATPVPALPPMPAPAPVLRGGGTRRRPRRLLSLRIAGISMLVIGVLTLAYGVVVLVWQDPITALEAAGNQQRADSQFSAMVQEVRRESRAETKALIARQAADLNLHTPIGHAVGRIVIPKIGIRFTLVQGTDDTTLEKGPGHYVETPLPGAAGHWTVGIAGHRTTYLAPFRHIDDLRPGDLVSVRMPYARFRYVVYTTKIVPAATKIALAADANITDRQRFNQLALTACNPPFSATQRIIVYARLQRVTPVRRGSQWRHVPRLF